MQHIISHRTLCWLFLCHAHLAMTTTAFVVPSPLPSSSASSLSLPAVRTGWAPRFRGMPWSRSSATSNPSRLVLRYQNSTSDDAVAIAVPSVREIAAQAAGSATAATTIACPKGRFHRDAAKETQAAQPCIIEIHGRRYNMTAWANAHPGGVKILQRFHNKDATKAFAAAGHSAEAYAMLKDFAIDDDDHHQHIHGSANDGTAQAAAASTAMPLQPPTLQGGRLVRMRRKLFTREDPIGVHKYLGIFCLLNFIGRYRQMLFQDPAAGLGTAGMAWFSLACLIPHALLSASSLMFHTVPKERVVGKPMIWKEFRMHNIIFGLRSVLCSAAAALAIRFGNTAMVRRVAVIFSSSCILTSLVLADAATKKLRGKKHESTTATMPYPPEFSEATRYRFKCFYAYAQFMATLACLSVCNPAWPLAVLFPIQIASLLMTLVRKSLISTRAYHYAYTASLVAPWLVGIRHMKIACSPDFAVMVTLGYAMYKLRCKGVRKYALWIPAVALRIAIGDSMINYTAW